jgi:hypothetical protein
MEKINLLEFYSKKQLRQLIELDIDDVVGDLDIYCKFKGLLLSGDNSPFYADGFFIIEETKWGLSSSIDPITGEESPPIDTCFITAITATKYSENNELLNNTYNLKTTYEQEEPLYNYDEFKTTLLKLGAPQTKSITELNKKSFNYDIGLINHKSNFTIEEASRIAANAPLKDQQGFFYPTNLVQHYQEIIAECITGHNQHKFHLMTKQLWSYRNDEDYGEHSIQHPNSSNLNVSCKVDIDLTIISKSEFLRWCKFMDIDTGLYNHQKNFDESIEELKAENEKLKQQQQQRPIQQQPLSMLNKNNIEKIEQLNTKIKTLTDEVELLKVNSFPVMTPKLKAALKAQNKFWLSYDENNPPLQKTVKHFIENELELNSLKENRDAAELTRAIQPEVIKRK